MSRGDRDLEKTVGGLIALVVFALLFAVEPFVAKTLWAWFVAPLGLPALDWSSAAGINLILNIWLGPRVTTKQSDDENLMALGNQLGRVALAFGLGWCIHVVVS
jgi:hypothetical protein